MPNFHPKDKQQLQEYVTVYGVADLIKQVHQILLIESDTNPSLLHIAYILRDCYERIMKQDARRA